MRDDEDLDDREDWEDEIGDEEAGREEEDARETIDEETSVDLSDLTDEELNGMAGFETKAEREAWEAMMAAETKAAREADAKVEREACEASEPRL